MPDYFSFLPYMRPGAAGTATRDAKGRLSSRYDVEIRGEGTAQGARIGLSATLKGPGDIIGFDRTQVARTEPEAGLQGFEPHYFPFVEFQETDFPWRYTPDVGTSERLRPWLSLIALKRDEFSYNPQGGAPLPSILVTSSAASLPDLSESWASAHVQINRAGPDEIGLDSLENDPAGGFSRLFCLRNLQPQSDYTLFLVPAYLAGVLAGMGLDPDEVDQDVTAWDLSVNAAIALPYYYSSTFRTSDGADLEDALRRLRAVDSDDPDDIGAPDSVYLHRPGYYEGLRLKKAEFERQSALQQPDYKPEKIIENTKLAKKMQVTLNEVIAGETDQEDDNDPLVAFPPYGFHYLEDPKIRMGRAKQNEWCDRINLDLKFRDAAALGARTVFENQESFSKLCWDQYEEIVATNSRISRLQSASVLAQRMTTNRFAKLPSDVSVALSEPFLPYATVSDDPKSANKVTDVFAKAGTPTAYPSRDLRRIAARKPVRNPDTGAYAIPAPKIPGDETASPISEPRDNSAITAIFEEQRAFENGDATMSALSQTFRNLHRSDFAGKPDPEANVELGTLKRPDSFSVNVDPISTQYLQAGLADRLTALPMLKRDFVVRGLSEAEKDAGDPVYRAPRVALPLADYLVKFSRNSLLSGVASLPDDTVSVFEENRKFIEAFMAGANHAMNDELRWREFPTDMKGTIFHRFWDRGAAMNDTASDEITDIHDWDKKLGKQFNPANPDGHSNLVVVIKGEAVRMLSDPIIVINIPVGQNWEEGSGVDHEPQFFGKLGKDIVYYGFDLSEDELLADGVLSKAVFVIYEPPGRLRFGLDIASDLNEGLPTESWDDLDWGDMSETSSGYLQYGSSPNIAQPSGAVHDLWTDKRSSAKLARAIWQKPIAALLPLRRVLDAKT